MAYTFQSQGYLWDQDDETPECYYCEKDWHQCQDNDEPGLFETGYLDKFICHDEDCLLQHAMDTTTDEITKYQES